VAVPNVGKFINRGKTEAKETDLHNVETAVMAMLADSVNGQLVAITTNDMDLVVTTDTVPKLLSAYLTGLNTDGTIKVPGVASYTFTALGEVTQNLSP
jgi:hypothetical protein